jgi:hypothetical protein
MKYFPDKWVVIRASDGETTYDKVFASWYGGFAGSDSWKLSSAIVSMVDEGNITTFHNESGSEYVCHKNSYGTSFYSHGILESWKEALPENFTIEVLEEYDVRVH